MCDDWYSPYSIPFPSDPKTFQELMDAPSWSGSLYGVPEGVMDVPGPEHDWRQPRGTGIVQDIATEVLWDQYFRGERPSPMQREPEPTFEERVFRCELMGILVCTCTSVQKDPDEPRLMLYSSACKIHGKV